MANRNCFVHMEVINNKVKMRFILAKFACFGQNIPILAKIPIETDTPIGRQKAGTVLAD